MSATTLFGLALLCLVASVAAQTGQVQLSVYSGFEGTDKNTCTGSVTPLNYTAGECKLQSSYFFDTTNIYSVAFFDANCTDIASVTQIPIGCNTYMYGYRFSTVGASPVFPFGTFPPAGYSTSTTYLNTTATAGKVTGCSAGNGIVAIQSAGRSKCTVRATGSMYTSPASTQGFCGNSVSGLVTFNDATCTTPAVAQQTTLSACDINAAGTSATAATCGDAPAFPSTIGVMGFVTYSNADCTSANPVTTLLSAGCFDRAQMVCGAVNGTDGYATYTTYTNTGADGSCGTVATEQSVLAGSCVPYPAGQTSVYRKYTCEFTPATGSASMASVSVIATLFAAIVAVFAVRSL